MPPQIEIETFSLANIRAVVKLNPLSEKQARDLVQKEKKGRARKGVIEFLAVQARKAARIEEVDRVLRAQAQARKSVRDTCTGTISA